MKCNALGVFALGAVMGTAAAIGLTAMDPAMRRRMCTKATRAGRLCMHRAERMFR